MCKCSSIDIQISVVNVIHFIVLNFYSSTSCQSSDVYMYIYFSSDAVLVRSLATCPDANKVLK